MRNHRLFRKTIFIALSLLFAGTLSQLFSSVAVTSSAQTRDEEYGRLIKEATTRPEFISPLVNYLPKADGVPTPKDILGYIAGAPGKLTYYGDILKYLKALDAACDNVRMFSIGKTSEGRDMVIVAVSDAATIKDLKTQKDLMARLADPRKVKTEAEAEALIARIKPVYWLTQNLHSTESGSSETCLELAYRLAVDENPIVKKIRDQLIVLITPSAEPDGHDKHTDWFYKYNKDVTTRDKVAGVPYWGKYDLHDNNRDMITMSQPEMRNIADAFFEWHPLVFQDNHEIGDLLYVSSSNGPSNFPPSAGSDMNLIAWFEVSQMTGFGMPGVYTHDFGNTMWSPNFMASVAPNHNAIFHFYETYGNSVANTMEKETSPQSRKEQWYKPIAPPEKFLWSMRNNVNYQQTADLLAFHAVASNKEFFLRNFWKRGLDNCIKGATEPPYAYVIPAGQKDPVDTAYLINVLLRQRIEVHRAKSEIKVKEGSYPAGSYVVRMDQPYRNLALTLLGIQKYPQDPSVTRVYDDAGWTLGLLMDVQTAEIKDKAIYDVPVVPLAELVKPEGKVFGKKTSGAYLVNNGSINTLLPARFKLKDFKVLASESPFKIKDKSFDAGSLIIPAAGNSDELHQALESAAVEFGLDVVSSESLPDVKTHELDIPRIAIFHTWSSTQDDGWVRYAFDDLRIPYSYIHKDHVRKESLKDKYDVIVFSNCGGRSGADIVNELDPGHRGPLAYVRSEEFKHLGTPDACEDITGGMGVEGVLNLQKFVQDGGLLIALQNPVRVVIDYGLVRGIRIYTPSAEFSNPGSLLKAEIVNSRHPAAYGYGQETALYRYGGPLLSIPKNMEKSVVVKYASKGEVCLSGLMKNESEIQGKAAIADVSLGKGHILLFTFNPFFRDSNHGNYMFVFNSILNHNDLDAAAQEEKPAKKS